jgi:hypothetical protein
VPLIVCKGLNNFDHSVVIILYLEAMTKYLNSPLKITGSLLMLAGLFFTIFTFDQFLFLGLSVFSLGVLIQVTAGILFKSPMKAGEKRWGEIALVFFILAFFGILLLDYLGIIKIIL